MLSAARVPAPRGGVWPHRDRDLDNILVVTTNNKRPTRSRPRDETAPRRVRRTMPHGPHTARVM